VHSPSLSSKVQSKEKILRILAVVSQMSVDLRLSQLLHLHSQGIIGTGKRRARAPFTKLKDDGLPHGWANSRRRWRRWLVNADDGTGVLDSGIVLFVIMLLVFVGIAAAIFPVGQEFEAEEGAFEYVALFAFILEMSLRMFAMGIGEYLRDRMCFMDFVVVMIDILLLTLEDYFGDFSAVQTNSTGGGSFGGLEHTNVLKSLRLLRFVRLVRLRRVFKAAAERLKKQEKGETLSEQDIKQFEDLFRKEEREAVNNKDNFGAALELNLMSKREPLAAICLTCSCTKATVCSRLLSSRLSDSFASARPWLMQ
jgi:hypothetical protein